MLSLLLKTMSHSISTVEFAVFELLSSLHVTKCNCMLDLTLVLQEKFKEDLHKSESLRVIQLFKNQFAVTSVMKCSEE